ncbi:DUF4376 domain-containing protein [Salmonella enterica]|nr:DUF4376 domain-containing protein [Salmonella enterica]
MTITVTDARNGRCNENGTITAEVQFSDGGRYFAYTAAAHDPADYGPQLYADLVAGKYGTVAPFTATPAMIQAAKLAKHNEIKRWRDVQENADWLFSYDGRRWDYGKTTQDRMSISLAMARKGALPEGFAWTDGDNDIVPMTNDSLIALAAGIEQAMFQKGLEINLRQLQMKKDVQVLDTLDAVRAYVVGWPDKEAS